MSTGTLKLVNVHHRAAIPVTFAVNNEEKLCGAYKFKLFDTYYTRSLINLRGHSQPVYQSPKCIRVHCKIYVIELTNCFKQ